MSALPEVVMATVDGKPDVVVVRWSTRPYLWDNSALWFREEAVTDRRPLLLIDPEDMEQVGRLMNAIRPGAMGGLDILAEALRFLAHPATPEPTGLGAVVRDGEGETWVRKGTIFESGEWTLQINEAFTSQPWPKIPQPVTVLNAGWSE